MTTAEQVLGLGYGVLWAWAAGSGAGTALGACWPQCCLMSYGLSVAYNSQPLGIGPFHMLWLGALHFMPTDSGGDTRLPVLVRQKFTHVFLLQYEWRGCIPGTPAA